MKKIIDEILRLKKLRNASILAHNYQLPEVQDIADFLGDSLELSRIAARLPSKIIVLCGVRFMAETASILCPDKKILIPDKNAGCPLADSITVKDLRLLQAKNPRAISVGYVNTTAEIKAELDYVCTSGNAISVVKHLKNKKEIIFVPDRCLGDYASKVTRRKLISWQGSCPIHVDIMPGHIKRMKKLHPQAAVLVHPECTSEVIALADAAVSTSGMCKLANKMKNKEFIIGTEKEMLYRLRKDNPGKKFFAASARAICDDMKKITLKKLFFSLKDMQYEVKVADDIRKKAIKPIKRMLSIT